MKTARFTHSHHCKNCLAWLSDHERMRSEGRCPRCGYKGPHACTIVETFESVILLIPNPDRRWWQVWKPRFIIQHVAL